MAIDANSLVTLADFKNYAGITVGTDDVLLQQTIDRASAVVCAYCGRKFVQQTFLEIRDTYGHERIALKQSPVSVVRFVGVGWDSAMTVQSTVSTDAFSSVSLDYEHVHLHRVQSTGASQTTTINLASHDTSVEMAAHINTVTGFSATALLNVPSTYLRKLVGRDLKNSVAYLEAPTDSLYDYQADLDAGILYGKQLALYRSMLIDYTAGYATIPLDVQQATMMIAARIFNGRKRDTGVQSESLGGYSYSLRGSAEVDAEAKELLTPHRRIR
jgi:hypothetical protein